MPPRANGGTSDATEVRRPPDMQPGPAKRATSPSKPPVRPEPRRPFSFDRPLHAATARLTAGLSPTALMQAYGDWAPHLLFSPDKQMRRICFSRPTSRWSSSRKPGANGRDTLNIVRTPVPILDAISASSRCPKTSGSTERRGGDGHSTPSIKGFCCHSNGGIARQPGSTASPSTMRTSFPSSPAKCWIWSLRRTFRSQIQKSSTPRSAEAG